MDKSEFISTLGDVANNPQTIHGIFHWCDRWCEKCSRTENCTLYNISTKIPNDKPDDFFKSLSMIFESTIDMLKELAGNQNIDFESECDRKKYQIRNEDGILLAKQYGKQVKHWLDSLKQKDSLGMEVRLHDSMSEDCLDVIRWYQYLFEVKFSRALTSQKEEEEENANAYDSLGNAKLLLVSIAKNIGAWGYIYQKFREDEDEILDILVCLQKLEKKIEQVFPDARAFIRPGLE
jgi:hypothetical protein